MNFNPFHKQIDQRIEDFQGYDDQIIRLVKETLINEDNFDEDTWENFVDNQLMGDCQLIVSFIKYNFPHIKKVFGEIEVDEPYIDKYGKEQVLMTHHWVDINGHICDFSKGTLIDYINWDDKYDPCIDDEEWRYNPISEN